MSEQELPKPDNQPKNSKPWLQPYQFKKGQSGNLKGRPKGKSMKEYARDYLASMTDEERLDFMEGIPKVDIWKLAEGNPAQDVTSGGEKIQIPIYGGLSISKHDSDQKDIQPDQENTGGSGGNISQ